MSKVTDLINDINSLSANAVDASLPADFASTLDVTGATTLDSTLSVLGTTTLTGAATFTGAATINDATFNATPVETVFTLTDGATVDIDPGNGSIQTLTLAGTARTLTFTNMVNGEAITLMINDGTDGTITTWNATFVNGGGAPTLSTTGFTVVAVWKVGGVVYAATVGAD